jgi:hypothetical protein
MTAHSESVQKCELSGNRPQKTKWLSFLAAFSALGISSATQAQDDGEVYELSPFSIA